MSNIKLSLELAVKVGEEAVKGAKASVKRSDFCDAAAAAGHLDLIAKSISVGVKAKLDKVQRKAFVSGWRVTLSRVTKEEPDGEYRLVYSIDGDAVTVRWEKVPEVDVVESIIKRLEKLETPDFDRVVTWMIARQG
jgi:hypothetical protein